MSSWETDLPIGIAAYLEAQGVGTYREDGTPATSGETAIVFGEMPASPDRVIAITGYAATDHPVQNLSSKRLQLMFRGLPNNSLDVDDIAAAAFAALHGLTNRDFGTAHLVQLGRVSSIPLGIDGNDRYTRADNYAADVNTPYTAARPL